jgi:hypothetical protein
MVILNAGVEDSIRPPFMICKLPGFDSNVMPVEKDFKTV